jgi:uncharacterized phage protein gp47/JayE
MPVPRPSQNEILQRIYNRILNETSITASLDSSVIGVLLKIIAAEMNLVWSYVEELYKQGNLNTATGPALVYPRVEEFLATFLGTPRRRP